MLSDELLDVIHDTFDSLLSWQDYSKDYIIEVFKGLAQLYTVVHQLLHVEDVPKLNERDSLLIVCQMFFDHLQDYYAK